MIKKLSLLFLSLSILVSSLVFSPTPTATAKSVTISTPYEFCKFFIERYADMGRSGSSCSDYPDVVGAPFSIDRTFGIEEDEEVTLKDLNLTYTSIRKPFTSWGGKIIIDGGIYTTDGSCMFVQAFMGDENVNRNFITIKSGDFISRKLVQRYTQTPICVLPREEANNEDYERAFENLLAPNSYFSEFRTETEIDLSKNIITSSDNFTKDYEETDAIGMLNRTQFSVRERVTTPEPTTEPEPQEPTPNESEQAVTEYPKPPIAGVK